MLYEFRFFLARSLSSLLGIKTCFAKKKTIFDNAELREDLRSYFDTWYDIKKADSQLELDKKNWIQKRVRFEDGREMDAWFTKDGKPTRLSEFDLMCDDYQFLN